MGKVRSETIMHWDGSMSTREPSPMLPRIPDNDDLILYDYKYNASLIPPVSVAHKGMWRYSALLPLDDQEIRYPLFVGNTPLIAPDPLRQLTQLPRLWLKDETRTPTGSNKDRATALVLEHALRNKIGVVSCASTGNVAVSLAVGAAASGIKAVNFVPAHVSESKLRIMQLAGATVFKVEGGYERAFAFSRKAARLLGWGDRNTGVNPLTLEAKKTVALEIWEQLGWRVPDVLVVPVGDGITMSAMVKGFRELKACGVTERLPRIIGVQAEYCQPLKEAWERGEVALQRQYQSPARTIADGIAVDAPIGAALALHDIQESKGAFVAVSDDDTLHAITILARYAGVLAEPAAASTFACLKPALASGLITPDDEVVLYITGSGLKQPQYLVPERPSSHLVHDFAGVERILSSF